MSFRREARNPALERNDLRDSSQAFYPSERGDLRFAQKTATRARNDRLDRFFSILLATQPPDFDGRGGGMVKLEHSANPGAG